MKFKKRNKLPTLPKTTKPLPAKANRGNVGKLITKLVFDNLHRIFIAVLYFFTDKAIFVQGFTNF